MTSGSPQTKQSRKTARRKSRQLRALVASMLAAPRPATRPILNSQGLPQGLALLESIGLATAPHSLRRI